MEGIRRCKALAHKIRLLFRPSRRHNSTEAEHHPEKPGSDSENSGTSFNLRTAHRLKGDRKGCDDEEASTPSRPRTTLETLPPKLQSQVLSSLASLDDLKAAVHASPALHQQYLSDQKRVLDRVLRSTLGDRVFVDAYAVQTSRPLGRLPFESPPMAIEMHLMTYQKLVDSSPDVIPVSERCTVEELIGMAVFYTGTIKPLLRRIPRLLLRNLDRSIKVDGLSRVEQTRILRALYRFQLWCNLYGTSQLACAREQTIDPYDILGYFFEVFNPWEIEEISCIYAFFMEMYEKVFADIKWDLDRDSLRFVEWTSTYTPDGSFDLEPFCELFLEPLPWMLPLGLGG